MLVASTTWEFYEYNLDICFVICILCFVLNTMLLDIPNKSDSVLKFELFLLMSLEPKMSLYLFIVTSDLLEVSVGYFDRRHFARVFNPLN